MKTASSLHLAVAILALTSAPAFAAQSEPSQLPLSGKTIALDTSSAETSYGCGGGGYGRGGGYRDRGRGYGRGY